MTDTAQDKGAPPTARPGTWDAVVRRLSDLFDGAAAHVRCNLAALAAALHGDPEAVDALADMAAAAAEGLALGKGIDEARVLRAVLAERERLPATARERFDDRLVGLLDGGRFPAELTPLVRLVAAVPSAVLPRLEDVLKREPADRYRALVALAGEQCADPAVLEIFADLGVTALYRFISSAKGDDDSRVLRAVLAQRGELPAANRARFDTRVAAELSRRLRHLDDAQTAPALLRLVSTPALLPVENVARLAVSSARSLDERDERSTAVRDQLRASLRTLAVAEAEAPEEWRRALRAALMVRLDELELTDRKAALFVLMRSAPELISPLPGAPAVASRASLRGAAWRGRRGNVWFLPIVLSAAAAAVAMLLLVVLARVLAYVEGSANPIGDAFGPLVYLFACGTLTGVAAVLLYAPTISRAIGLPGRIQHVLLPALAGALVPLPFVSLSEWFDTRSPLPVYLSLFGGQALLLAVTLLLLPWLAGAALRTRRLGSENPSTLWAVAPALAPPTLLCVVAGAIGYDFLAQFWPIFWTTGLATAAGAWRIEARSVLTFAPPAEAQDRWIVTGAQWAGGIVVAACVLGAASSSLLIYRKPIAYRMEGSRREATLKLSVLRPVRVATAVPLRIDLPTKDAPAMVGSDSVAARSGGSRWARAGDSFRATRDTQICYGCDENWAVMKNWLPLILPVQRGNSVTLKVVAPLPPAIPPYPETTVTLNGGRDLDLQEGQIATILVPEGQAYDVTATGTGSRQSAAEFVVTEAEGGEFARLEQLKPGTHRLCAYFGPADRAGCDDGGDRLFHERGTARVKFAPAPL